MNIDQNLIFLFLVSQEYLTWVIASAAKSTEKKTCNLKNSHLTFTFSGVEWSCQKYCPGIRGCEDECCAERSMQMPKNETAGKRVPRNNNKGSCSKCILILLAIISGVILTVALAMRMRQIGTIAKRCEEALQALVKPENNASITMDKKHPCNTDNQESKSVGVNVVALLLPQAVAQPEDDDDECTPERVSRILETAV